MSVYLAHHRAFCEELGRLHALCVSWDGNGSIPLKRKPLQTAMEFFGRRPDLTIGSKVVLDRGGLDISLFRGGRDLRLYICREGTILASGHRPRSHPDFTISCQNVTESFVRHVSEVIPLTDDLPFLSKNSEDDITLSHPFEGFAVLRIQGSEAEGQGRVFIGREGFIPDVYAYHDACDLPEDIYHDQPLSGSVGLWDMIKSYIRERCKNGMPA